ncbi:MAG: hypothetical protein Kow0068_20510 [Marinilabiliales bacterium]
MRKVLVVDDVINNYTYLMAVLNKLDCEVVYANNGLDAIEIIKKDKDIEMVFMDLKLPGINGIEAIKITKEIRPDIIVIAVTAYSTLDIRKKAFEAGCDEYLTKPIVFQQIVNVLDKYPRRIKFISKNKEKTRSKFQKLFSSLISF